MEQHYEIWWGGTDRRHRTAHTEDEARENADEFDADGQIGIEILKVTPTREVIDR